MQPRSRADRVRWIPSPITCNNNPGIQCYFSFFFLTFDKSHMWRFIFCTTLWKESKVVLKYTDLIKTWFKLVSWFYYYYFFFSSSSSSYFFLLFPNFSYSKEGGGGGMLLDAIFPLNPLPFFFYSRGAWLRGGKVLVLTITPDYNLVLICLSCFSW